MRFNKNVKNIKKKNNSKNSNFEKLDEMIQDEIRKLKIVRRARILASERLGGYASKWDMYLLLMAILSSALLVISLIVPNEGLIKKVVSGCFSMYTVIIQYYVSTLNYRERALKFHYHHIEINKLKESLQWLSLQGYNFKKKNAKFKVIVEKYNLILQQQENHSEYDYHRAKCKEMRQLDFSMDNIFVNIQPIVIILFILSYLFLGGICNETTI